MEVPLVVQGLFRGLGWLTALFLAGIGIGIAKSSGYLFRRVKDALGLETIFG
jgi:hypothetical protein